MQNIHTAKPYNVRRIFHNKYVGILFVAESVGF